MTSYDKSPQIIEDLTSSDLWRQLFRKHYRNDNIIPTCHQVEPDIPYIFAVSRWRAQM